MTADRPDDQREPGDADEQSSSSPASQAREDAEPHGDSSPDSAVPRQDAGGRDASSDSSAADERSSSSSGSQARQNASASEDADERGSSNSAGQAPLPSDRAEPVGAPVVRGDEAVTGQHAQEAVQFDPDDPESLQQAAETVRAFAENTAGADDNVYMLRGAAACAALVRGEGSYKAAAERAGGEASVAFIRKWARVHDLPQSIRRHVAIGHIAPTAAKHIARVSGNARFDLAWAVLDNDLTVREVRTLASEVNDGATVEAALADHEVRLGRIALDLPPDVYRELRRRAALDGSDPDVIAARALDREFGDR